MNKYEIAVVFATNENDAAYGEEIEKMQALITRFGGVVDKIDNWGKRKLAYEIRKQTEGYYSFITFMAEPTVPREIESRVRITETILRYLIIRAN